MYRLTLRGAPGNPTADQFKNNLDQATNAFELSPERGRYTQVANMAENGVYNLSKTWADIAYPDVGVSSDGKLDSYFAPGVSYFTLPFYLFGAQYGLGQVATFSAESLISIVTLVFIYLIGLRIFALPQKDYSPSLSTHLDQPHGTMPSSLSNALQRILSSPHFMRHGASHKATLDIDSSAAYVGSRMRF